MKVVPWFFDTAATNGSLILARELAAVRELPMIDYVAFFSDVEHEVAPVISGHRVTLTYNLYFDNAEGTASSS